MTTHPLACGLLVLFALEPLVPAQSATLLTDCLARVDRGGQHAEQSLPAQTTLQPGTGFQLAPTLGNTTAECTFQLQPDGFQFTGRALAAFTSQPVAAQTGGTILVHLLIPSRGSLHLSATSTPTGGPGFGVGTIRVDIGDNGTEELHAHPYWTSFSFHHSEFLANAQLLAVRITHAGTLTSSLVDDYSCTLDAVFVADSCPTASYGSGCFYLEGYQERGGLVYHAQTGLRPVILAFGFLPRDLPIPGSPCRQFLAAEVAVWLPWSEPGHTLPPFPLPPGFRLYAQAAAPDGVTIRTSNGVALVCPQ